MSSSLSIRSIRYEKSCKAIKHRVGILLISIGRLEVELSPPQSGVAKSMLQALLLMNIRTK